MNGDEEATSGWWRDWTTMVRAVLAAIYPGAHILAEVVGAANSQPFVGNPVLRNVILPIAWNVLIKREEQSSRTWTASYSFTFYRG